ncbi:MAG: tetratricopeptide repeat protein, partial [Spirochaetales bacterium]|nr:tetratricopeptide repeat protein [Spirochaetales bacterium]
MTTHILNKSLLRTENLKEKVDLYNRFFSARRDDFPLHLLEKMDEALVLSHRSAYTQGVFETLIHRAYVYIQISENSKAEEDIGRVKQLYKEDSGWDRENMFFFHLLCIHYCEKSYPGLCSDYAYRCLSLSRKLNENSMSSSIHAVLGRMQFKMGKITEAEESYSRALDLLIPDGEGLISSMINCYLGELYGSTGRTAKARCCFHQGYRQIKGHSPGSRGYAWVLRKFATFEESMGNLATAEYLYGEAVNTLERKELHSLAAEFRLGLGRLLLTRGEVEGLRLLTEQREALGEKGMYEEVLAIGDLLSNYYLEEGDKESAVRELIVQRNFTREFMASMKRTRDDSYEKEQWLTARENLTQVHSLGVKLAACQSREDIFLVLRESLGFLEEDDGLIVAEERSESQLELIYCNIHGINGALRFFPNNPESSMISYCLKNNQSILINDFEEEKNFFMSQPVKRFKLDGDFPPSLSLLNLVYERESARGV